MSARLRVRLTPRAGADRVDGVADGVLRVRVAAAPVDGAANEALCRLIAREIALPRTSIRIASGATSRVKVVEIDGAGEDALRARWPGLA
jgi:uncharacterized protein YggU (UPF0235/DUF167 family)